MDVTGANNRKLHAVQARVTVKDGKPTNLFYTACGLEFPARPQATQETLPRCKRCL